MQVILKTVRDREISGKFLTPSVLGTTPLGPLKCLDFFKFGRHLELWWKWKISFISKTVRDRAISGKFHTPGIIRTTPLAPLKNLDISNFWLPS